MHQLVICTAILIPQQISSLHIHESGADPGFPIGGSANRPGGGDANIWNCQIFQKTAWNWENFGP